MKSWEEKKMIREEGYAEGYDNGFDSGFDGGQDRINMLIIKLHEAGRADDIVRAAMDKTYQESLFEEFNL